MSTSPALPVRRGRSVSRHHRVRNRPRPTTAHDGAAPSSATPRAGARDYIPIGSTLRKTRQASGGASPTCGPVQGIGPLARGRQNGCLRSRPRCELDSGHRNAIVSQGRSGRHTAIPRCRVRGPNSHGHCRITRPGILCLRAPDTRICASLSIEMAWTRRARSAVRVRHMGEQTITDRMAALRSFALAGGYDGPGHWSAGRLENR
jgi:hypothetical protein